MSEVFFISDTHFGHKGIITFSQTREHRPFETIEEHDEYLVDRWNSVVTKQDVVWHLGDVCFGKRNLDIVGRLNGTKKLVMGNHDMYANEDYLKHFSKLYGIAEYKGMILSHAPLHTNQLKRWYLNIHGHLHEKIVLDESGNRDIRYFNVSCEQINLTPIPLDEIYNYWAEYR